MERELGQWRDLAHRALTRSRADKHSLPHGYDLGYAEGREDTLSGDLAYLTSLLGDGEEVEG